jgi:hypothetical protein
LVTAWFGVSGKKRQRLGGGGGDATGGARADAEDVAEASGAPGAGV